MNGLFNEMTYFNGVPETVADILKHYDDLGGPNSYPHYAAGWAVAGDAPFAWTKQVAGSYGGTRNRLVVHWPKGIKAKGEVRSQWHHVIDIAPTILEAAGLPEPKVVNGTPQTPIEGVSMVYTFADAKAKDRHKTQYFEIFGNRGIYHDGWLAHTVHRAAWEAQAARAVPRRQVGTLPHRPRTSARRTIWPPAIPTSSRRLQELFLKEAVKNHVLPLDDRGLERVNAALAGRPDLMAGRTSLTVYEGMIGMTENVFINTKNPSHTITADVEIPEGRRQRRDPGPGRPLRRLEPVRQGWQADVHLQLPRPRALQRSLHRKPLPAGKATIRFEFAYDGGGRARAASARSSSTARKSPKGGSTARRLCLLGR